ncbi:MAG TPA: hypothetical protein VEQ63_08705, partial [Bryobacteraceae bacterium]|nr:hypothetical protein [Bryobacteraceae bacterium]
NGVLRRTLSNLAAGDPSLGSFVSSVLQQACHQTDAATAAVFRYNVRSCTLELTAAAVITPGQSPFLDPFLCPVPADLTAAWPELLASAEQLLLHPTDDPPLAWPHAIATHQNAGHRMLASRLATGRLASGTRVA